MLAGIFRKLIKQDGSSLFVSFYRCVQNVYSVLNRVLNGDSYITLKGNTFITTPILTNGNVNLTESAPLTDFSQVCDPPTDKLLQISEIDYTPIDIDIPTGYVGALAYGNYYNSQSTLYYWRPNNATSPVDNEGTWQLVKLGWGGGVGTYNNGSTFAQTYSGFPHGTGDYTIVTSNQYVDIQFDFIHVISVLNGEKDIVSSVANNPITPYNIRINPTSIGLNGVLDSTFTSSTGYYVWFLYNPTNLTYGAGLSTDYSNPTLPEGYNYVQRIGWVSASSGVLAPSVQVNNKFNFISPPAALSSASVSLAQNSYSVVNLITNTVPEGINYPYKSFISSIDLGYKLNSLNIGTMSGVYLEYGAFWNNNSVVSSPLNYSPSFANYSLNSQQFSSASFSGAEYVDLMTDIPVPQNQNDNWFLEFYTYNKTSSSGTATLSYSISSYGFLLRNLLIGN